MATTGNEMEEINAKNAELETQVTFLLGQNVKLDSQNKNLGAIIEQQNKLIYKKNEELTQLELARATL